MTLSELRKTAGGKLFAEIDLVFADFLLERAETSHPALFAAAALASFAVRAGNSCCDLKRYAGRIFPESADPEDSEHPGILLPSLEPWIGELRRSEFRRVISFYPETENPVTPLVMDSECRLYLQRYFAYEKQLAERIRQRACAPAETMVLPAGKLASLSSYFRDAASLPETDWQQLAVFLSCSRSFSIITGGPGTGKTTVAAALLALELERNPERRILLCAPTGKAQARLRESILQGIASLSCGEEIRRKLSEIPCGTIHSILKTVPGTTQFRYQERRPLRTDLVVVDEASMVSLSLMAKLMKALPQEAKVVLLGDKDQLASVDAGAVLADICSCGTKNVMIPATAEEFRRQTSWSVPPASDSLPLSGSIAELKKNHRSAKAPSISSVSAAIRDISGAADSRRIAERIALCREPDFLTEPLPRAGFESALRKKIERKCIRFRDGSLHSFTELPSLAADSAADSTERLFELIRRFQILCALRNGPFGTQAVNEILRRQLRMTEPFAVGMPLMITRNQPERGLFNGDIGLVRRENGLLRIVFPNPEHPGKYRSFLPVELPEHEPVFGMTVHKSQGSGFQNVLIVFPDHDSPLLTRELLYTAITRAEEQVTLWADPDLISGALDRLTVRQSGLRDRLMECIRDSSAERTTE